MEETLFDRNGAVASTSSENGCSASKRPEAGGSVEETLFDLERSGSEYQQRKRVLRKQATRGRRERGGDPFRPGTER